jgi:hypothetical protein
MPPFRSGESIDLVARDDSVNPEFSRISRVN